jgi:lipopolysaccharide transport system ATP-binding protein
MSLSISIENVSKVYRLGEINRSQFFGDIRRWAKSKFNPYHAFGDPETEAEQEPKAPDLFYALKNISFEVKQGETVAIIGANGAGKSTLLKLISRITAPSSGIIRINGRIGSLLEVGTGFQSDLTGRENVYMNGAILGMSRKEVSAKFDDIVSFSGIEKFIDTPVKRYSSGMGVRLAFSVAAFLEPEILIVDEVLSVGDQSFQNRCIQRLKDIIKDGRTVLFVSHGAGQVRELCNRAICLKRGEVICDDNPSTALDHYQAAISESVTAVNRPSGNKNIVPEVIYTEEKRPGNHIVRITSGRLHNESGQSVSSVLSSEPLKLEFEYEIYQPGYRLRPICRVCDERGNIIFWTADSDVKLRSEDSKVGVHRASFTVPGRFLSPAKLIFNLGIEDAGESAQQHAHAANALSILIEDDLSDEETRGAYQGIIAGFVRPKLDWKTENA